MYNHPCSLHTICFGPLLKVLCRLDLGVIVYDANFRECICNDFYYLYQSQWGQEKIL